MLFSLGFLLLIEGLGLMPDRQILLILALIVPILALLEILLTPKLVLLPKKIAWLIAALIFFLLISLTLSQDKAQSLPQFLLFLGGLGLTVYSANHKERLKKALPYLVLSLALIFASYALWLKWQTDELQFLWLIPKNGYNLVYGNFPQHNHLGDWLALTAAYLPLSLPFFWPQIFLSLSRSSLVALFLTLGLRLKDEWANFNKKRRLLLILGLCFAIIAFLFANSQKNFFNGRDDLLLTTWETVKIYPWFGLGQGNFLTANLRFGQSPPVWTTDAANIFLHLLAEVGIMGSLTFFGLVCWIIIQAQKKTNIFYLFLALLILFQTDYIYSLHSLWLFFFVLLGLQIKKTPGEIILPKAILSGAAVMIAAFILMSNLYYFSLGVNQPALALRLYPWGKEAHRSLLAEALIDNNWQEMPRLNQRFAEQFPLDTSVQQEAAAIYLRLNMKQEALASLKQAYLWHPFEYGLYKEVYYLSNSLSGKRAARQSLNSYQERLSQTREGWHKENLIKDLKQFRALEQR